MITEENQKEVKSEAPTFGIKAVGIDFNPIATAKQNKPATIKSLFAQDNVKKKFEEMLGKKAVGFMTSVLQVISSNRGFENVEAVSIYNAAATAATLDLPINQNLGFAYIIPYKGLAQFQIGWRGLVQLAQRTGQYLKINAIEVYENQFKSYNSLTEELAADFNIEGEGKIVGYAAYFKLLNGFEKTTYWSVIKVMAHAKKYSQAYNSEKGITPWKDKDQVHEMGKKTVLKNTLSKWGILSIEMQKAINVDQAVINNEEGTDITYVDHEEIKEEITQEDLKDLFEMKKDSMNEKQKVAALRIIDTNEKNSFSKLKRELMSL